MNEEMKGQVRHILTSVGGVLVGLGYVQLGRTSCRYGDSSGWFCLVLSRQEARCVTKYAALLMAVIQLVGTIARWMADKQVISQVEAANAAAELEQINKALRARAAVDVSPERLRENDGHRRD